MIVMMIIKTFEGGLVRKIVFYSTLAPIQRKKISEVPPTSVGPPELTFCGSGSLYLLLGVQRLPLVFSNLRAEKAHFKRKYETLGISAEKGKETYMLKAPNKITKAGRHGAS